MAAPHFFVDRLDEREVVLGARDSHHALQSLRLRPGEELSLADGTGGMAKGVLRGQVDGRAVIEVASSWREQPHLPSVSVAFAPPANEGARWAIQKMTELGVDEIVVFEAERSVRRWKGDRANLTSRFASVVHEAAMQSHQPFESKLVVGRILQGVLDQPETSVFLLQGASRRLGEVLPDGAERVRVIVGPEGGWAEREIEVAEQLGVALASLGPPILRTETAAVVGAALVLAHYGRLG